MKIPVIDDVRRNHAIEHAVVTLLLERGARVPMGGYSIPSGFVIWSRSRVEEVSLATRDAIALLKAGNSDLAISPFCGTNIATCALVGALAAKIFSGRKKTRFSTLRGIVAAMAAVAFLGRPLGRLFQRHFTTLPYIEGVEVLEIRQILASPVSVVWISMSHENV